MNMNIRTSDVRWLAPVYVRIGYGIPEAVRSPKDALNHLLYRWPASCGNARREAEASCAKAMQLKYACDAAREAFIRACIEAMVLD
jgi:hypothetical protein